MLRSSASCVSRLPTRARPVSRALSSRAGGGGRRGGDSSGADGQHLHVLFPRKGAYQASMEVKKRILYATPHMGGNKLKKLARLHARKGTMDSFVADLESRLDRFIYRCNLVPSIFAARHVIGHKHILVNGFPTNRSSLLLKPMSIVEPRPSSKALFRRLARRRLRSNTFAIAPSALPEEEEEEEEEGGEAAPGRRSGADQRADLDRLLADATPPRVYRLPPPVAGAAAPAGSLGSASHASRLEQARGSPSPPPPTPTQPPFRAPPPPTRPRRRAAAPSPDCRCCSLSSRP